MAMVTTQRCRIRGTLPARFVQKRKTRGSSFSRQRVGHYPVMHMEPDHKIDDFMMYSEPDEEEEEELDAAAAAAAAEAELVSAGNHGSSGRRRGVITPQEVDVSAAAAERQPAGDADGAAAAGANIDPPSAVVKPFFQRCLPISYNVTDYIVARSLGTSKYMRLSVSDEYGTRHMLTTGMFKEFPISLMPSTLRQHRGPSATASARPTVVDKVFCSQWLSNSKIIMGTKCNKIKLYNTDNHSLYSIPQLVHLAPEANPPITPHGVYTIKLNPSKTLMATVGHLGRDVAIYRLPNLEPVCLGQKSHTEGILDLCWLDDDFLVSGGMDRQMALWRVDNYQQRSYFNDLGVDEDTEPPLPVISPLRIKKCTGADKVRAVIFNERNSEIVSLSTNAFLHVWDPERFYQKISRKLPHAMENVCLTQKDDASLYAVGSKSHFTLLDPRTLHHVKKVSARINGCSVKSLSFHRDILTIGTAVGAILFYDMRAGKYMESTMNSGRAVMLKCSRGFVHLEEAAMELMPNADYSPTIYTHCYDQSGTRLFAAGGPLSVTLRGHYAGIWR
uniref:DDB1-and CUL4-associated factor 12-like n=2 Tax=Hirondellea gigas TaxID=1518452 RepID=A0A6A7FTU2_9CRUS